MAGRNLHGILWRWHFLAGIAACPILLVVALTGSIYAFQPELERWANPELLVVDPVGERRPLDQLVAAVPSSCTPKEVTVPGGRDRPVQVICAESEHRHVFLDPYRGRLLGQWDWDRTFFGVVWGLHWELLLGDEGRLAIEWSTSWALLLMLSGIALWWPRGQRRAGGVWWPRRGLSGRQRLRDLHAVLGAYVVPVLFALAATGLFWTLLAGQKRWHPLSEDAVHDAFEPPPTSQIVIGAPRIGLDRAVRGAGIDLARERRAVYIGLPAAPDDAYLFFLYDESFARPSVFMANWVDAYSGARLRQTSWAEHSAIGMIDGAAYSIHVGAILGLPGRILACVAGTILAASCVTGPWMWWKRRTRRGLGAPPRGGQAPWPLVALLAGLGWLLPTVGWTLLAILAIEAGARIWRRRLTSSFTP